MLIHIVRRRAAAAAKNKRPCGRLLFVVCPDGIINELALVGLLA